MKRSRATASDISTDDASSSSSSTLFCVPKRRAMSTKTVDKWITEHEKALNTSTWLEYEQGPPLEQWNSENAVKLWWGDKTRRVNRSEPSTSSGVSRSQAASQSEQPTWTLDDWDTWLDSD